MGRAIAWCNYCTDLWQECESLDKARGAVARHYALRHPRVQPPDWPEEPRLEASLKPVTIADVAELVVEQLVLWSEAA